MDQFKCINAVFSEKQKQLFKKLPVKNGIYTLKEIVVSSIDGKEGYVFEELPNPKHKNGQEFSFRPSRFVPVEDVTIDSLIEENVEYEK